MSSRGLTRRVANRLQGPALNWRPWPGSCRPQGHRGAGEDRPDHQGGGPQDGVVLASSTSRASWRRGYTAPTSRCWPAYLLSSSLGPGGSGPCVARIPRLVGASEGKGHNASLRRGTVNAVRSGLFDPRATSGRFV